MPVEIGDGANCSHWRRTESFRRNPAHRPRRVDQGFDHCHTHLLARFDRDPSSFGVELLHKSNSYRTLEAAGYAAATVRAGLMTVRDVKSEGRATGTWRCAMRSTQA